MKKTTVLMFSGLMVVAAIYLVTAVKAVREEMQDEDLETGPEEQEDEVLDQEGRAVDEVGPYLGDPERPRYH